MNIRKNDLVAVSSLTSPVRYGRVIEVNEKNVLVSVGGNIINCKHKEVTRVYEKGLIKRLKNENKNF